MVCRLVLVSCHSCVKLLLGVFLNCGGGRQLKIGLVVIGLGCDACRCSRTILSVCVSWCCTVAYDFILVIVVTSLFCYSHFHTLTLLGGLYQMFLDSAAVLCCLFRRDLC